MDPEKLWGLPVGHQHRGLIIIHQTARQQRPHRLIDKFAETEPAPGGSDNVTSLEIHIPATNDVEDRSIVWLANIK